MPASYVISIHRGSTIAAPGVFVNFTNYAGDPLKSQTIWVNIWDNPVYIKWKKSDGTYTDEWEWDNAWQPIQPPIAFSGFQIYDKTPGFHGRYQVIAMSG